MLRSIDRPVRARLSAAMAGVLVVAVALSGCAAGQRAQTANEFSVVQGVAGNVGSMGLRDAGINPPASAAGFVKGANATLSMTLINNGQSSDALVSVTTPNAAGATLAAPASATGSRTAGQIAVPPNGAVPIGGDPAGGTITLHKLTYRLVPGQSIPVTLNFQVAGQVTVMLPVKLVPNQTGGETVNVAPPTDAPVN